MNSVRCGKATIGVAQRSADGERVCGDGYVVAEYRSVLVLGVADGLGHGREAAAASDVFCDYIRAHVAESLSALMHGCHRAMRETRGAAAVILRFEQEKGELGVCGIGNVAIRALSQERIEPVNARGILGRRLQRVRTYTYAVHSGDLLVVYSDGVASRWDLRRHGSAQPQALADRVLHEFGKSHDDATCAVVRYG